ncbi:MAG: putative periplasmic protein [Enterovirga sp.]|jgi:uncharacterized protein YigE (DUF2233 family)|nr:putative periplasmic protein [Enterovirga sp.]
MPPLTRSGLTQGRPPRNRHLAWCVAVALLASGPAAAAAPAATAASPPSGCRAAVHDGARYTVCTFDLRRYAIRLFHADREGRPFGSLQQLVRAPEGARLAMAMNAGMYHHDLSPVGLYVEDGQERKALNRSGGPGNFHMRPNGVFYVAGGQAGVLETGAYAKRRPKAAFATQSGPMLVIDGRLHPRFSEEGPSRKIRNGVGVQSGNQVVFAISDEPVSFGAFARLFRDQLGCRNALFLDGSISALHAPDLGRTDISFKPLGPIVAAVAR